MSFSFCSNSNEYVVSSEKLPGTIVEKQTLAVDAVAGCTVTSKAVLAAAEDALRQAGAENTVIFSAPADAVDAAQEEIDCNLVIVGAGAAGLSAALSAHENGVEDILVIEKMSWILRALPYTSQRMAAFTS